MSDVPLAVILSMLVLWAFVALHSVVLVGMVRLAAQIQTTVSGLEMRVQGPPTGASIDGMPLPLLEMWDVEGNRLPSSTIGEKAGLVLISPGCPSCTAVLYALESIRELDGIIMVCHGGNEECRELAASHGLTWPTVADPDGLIRKQLAVDSYPAAILIENQKMFGHDPNVVAEIFRDALARQEAEIGVNTR